MAKKYFSLAEANALLPIVAKELESLQNIKRRFEEQYVDLQERKETEPVSPAAGSDPFFTRECELEFMEIEARSLIRSIHLKGVELKDIEAGLVDFPALLNGEEVLLCWKQGEETISHYHGLFDGFAGRKPIEP